MKIALIIVVIACIAYYFYNSANTKKTAALNLEQGSVFLAENSKKEGVKTTASGLQYEVLQSGNGDKHPTASSTVKVHYHGTLTDGTVFDSSVERGETISFPLNRVIPGWTEGLQLMKVGDKFRFYIPSNLAYGNRSTGKIPAGSVLIFDVELFEIQ
jgi:peptidylprolyl isomerase